MGDLKDLINEEAIEKIKELAEGKTCLFCTNEEDGIVSRPMSTQQVEEDGSIWFFSAKDSHKNQEIKADKKSLPDVPG